MARLIDADALKDKFIFFRKMWSNTEIFMTIDQVHTVDAVPVVHGRWVRKAHDGAFGVFRLWHCSVCDTIRARQDPYCGECGAKMDGGADNG